MQPTVGRIVHYHLTAAQAENLTPDKGGDPWSRSRAEEPEPYSEGDVVAAIVARVNPTPDLVSLRLVPDVGWDTPAIRNVGGGCLPGEWEWPPRV